VSAGAERLTSCAEGGMCGIPEYHELVAIEAAAVSRLS
jgi:hypothetical protein